MTDYKTLKIYFLCLLFCSFPPFMVSAFSVCLQLSVICRVLGCIKLSFPPNDSIKLIIKLISGETGWPWNISPASFFLLWNTAAALNLCAKPCSVSEVVDTNIPVFSEHTKCYINTWERARSAHSWGTNMSTGSLTSHLAGAHLENPDRRQVTLKTVPVEEGGISDKTHPSQYSSTEVCGASLGSHRAVPGWHDIT